MRRAAEVQRQDGGAVEDDVGVQENVGGPPEVVARAHRAEEVQPLEQDGRLDRHELGAVEGDAAGPELGRRRTFRSGFGATVMVS